MAEPRPLVVVIVPFVAWGPLLERCIAGCLALEDESFHVCLVPSTAASVPARWAGEPRVSVVASTGDGIAHKRNAAIRAFPQAAFYACIDSDAWPQADWLAEARRAFAADADIWGVGGPNLDPPGLDPQQAPVAAALRSLLVSGPKVFTKQLAASRDVPDLPTCNLILRREAVEAVGGFDTSVEVGEDSVLCQRVVACGKRIRFDREVRVFHEPRRFGLPFLRQKIVSGYGIPPLLRRCWRSMTVGAIIAELLPLLALLWFLLGWLSGWLQPLWQGVLIAYAALVGAETLRLAPGPRLWLRTAAALLVGNLAPGIGTLFRLAGGRLRLSRFYRNDDGVVTPT